MARCKYCGAVSEDEELLRRERDSLVAVYCPDCHALLGQYTARTGDEAGWR